MSESHKGYTPVSAFKKGNKPWNRNVAQCAYFAGLIDGEGSLQITDNGTGKWNPEHRYKRISVRITLLSEKGGKEILEEAHKEWGGWIYVRRGIYTEWVLQHGDAEVFLRQIIHFIRGKKRQVEILLRYRDLQMKKKLRDGGPGLNKITPEAISIRESLEQELKALHIK